MPNIQVPERGLIAFPDDMSHEDINRAVQTIVAGAPLSGPISGSNPDPILNAPPPTGVAHGLSQGLDELAAAPGAIAHQVIHPVDTVRHMGQQQRELSQRASSDWNSGHYGNAIWHAADSMVPVLGPMDASLTDQYQGGDKSGAMARGAVEALPSLFDLNDARPLVTKGVNAAKSAAGSLVDNGVGLLSKDTKFGATPGESYLEGGGTPALTMKGLASKAGAVQSKAGQALGDAYQQATDAGVTIDPNAVLGRVADQTDALRRLQNGPGGTGETPQIYNYETNLLDPMAKAVDNGGFSPKSLFEEMKKPISKNTNWKDQTQLDMNKVRQQNTSAIGDLLTDAVPGTADLNRVYQGSGNLAERAEQRAAGSSSLGNWGRKAALELLGAGAAHAIPGGQLAYALPLLDTLPVRTTAGWLLHHGAELTGKAADAVGPTAARRGGVLGSVNGEGR